MIERNIERTEVEAAIMRGEIVEEYPEDKYSPCCLLYGKTVIGMELHVQVSLPPNVVVVTTCEPDPAEWLDGKVRR
ncbi:MAG: DUF4258 domain-containing protein [Deltaproteobacteria bacterium]|nr:DUF4258 domain-containing protein [Deltaproteobacteria bacterium]